jgi:hypothetical protein
MLALRVPNVTAVLGQELHYFVDAVENRFEMSPIEMVVDLPQFVACFNNTPDATVPGTTSSGTTRNRLSF